MLIPVLFLIFGGPPSLARQVLPEGESVMAPIKLVLFKEDLESGGKFYAAADGKAAYLVSRSVLKGGASNPQSVLANATAGLADGAQATIVSTLPISLAGWPGLECELRSKRGLGARFRTYVVKGAMYQLGYMSLAGVSANSTESSAFLDSFGFPGATPRGSLPDDKPGWRRVYVEKSDLSAEFSAKPKVDEVEMPSAPADSPVRMQRVALQTPVETLIIATIPMPAVIADQLDVTKEAEGFDKIAQDMFKVFDAKGERPSEQLLHGRRVVSYEFKGENGVGRLDIFRKGDAIHLAVFLGRSGVFGPEDEKRFFGSLQLTGN